MNFKKIFTTILVGIILVSNSAFAAEVPTKEKSSKELLLYMMDSAKQGKVINCIYPVNTTVIEDVTEVWGEPDKMQYIASAKGTYADFSKRKVIFGFNKGSQIFEVESFDDKLKCITLNEAIETLGKPEYMKSLNGENIVGYMASGDYRLLLVFVNNSEDNTNFTLDHYSVLYPGGTANLMAGDPGRDWSILKQGDTFSLSLGGNPTTGYTWHCKIEDKAVINLLARKDAVNSGLIGAGNVSVWDFKALKAGNTKITFKYYRDWEGESSATPENTIVYNMSVN